MGTNSSTRTVLEVTDVEVSEATEPDFIRHAVGHDNDEGLAFALGNQVVHNQIGMALDSPTVFVLAPTVLQIENGIMPFQLLVIARRSVDERATSGVGALREEQDFAKLTMRHILDGVEITIVGRHLDATAPSHGAEEVDTVGIRNFGPVDRQRVIVKPLVQRPCVARPDPIIVFCELAAVSEATRNAFRVRRNNPEHDATF